MTEHNHRESAGTAGEATTAVGEPRLEATDIDFSYGDVAVLGGVSASIDAASVTALIGPNGSGKTTLLRTLAGLHDPTGGEIVYRGPPAARRVGYLPQRPAFRPGFTVLETLTFYASLVGGDRADASARLERVGLADADDRQVDALSGGMTRLVGIAQATIGDPPVVVLDEPASGLDPGMSKRVFEIASELAETGTAVVLSSHDLELVDSEADRILLLDGGEIVERGSPDSVRDRLDVASLRGAYEASIEGDLRRVRVQSQGETS
ncbi:ABC transporter ATP-binding protein [Natrarchaeobius sp. A-rgal3]|uniref:ABC transporter ATP-binding protein n=1 Tax=Natrarchaeobius versutus TaxID=1679078 RepID=UPI00350F3735